MWERERETVIENEAILKKMWFFLLFIFYIYALCACTSNISYALQDTIFCAEWFTDEDEA